MRSPLFATICLLLFPFLSRAVSPADSTHPVIQIVFTSDVHFGITRPAFDGDSNVPSVKVNARLVSKINHLPALSLPPDAGVDAGRTVGPIDYVMIAGDIANREETPIQSAAASWDQFRDDYLEGIHTPRPPQPANRFSARTRQPRRIGRRRFLPYHGPSHRRHQHGRDL